MLTISKVSCLQCMGNSNQDKNSPENFRNTCHPGLSDCTYDKSTQLLMLSIKAQEGMELWRNDVDPLMRSKHLFLPHHYGSQEDIQSGCCAQQDTNHQAVSSYVFYLPFYYTLDKEIMTRRDKKSLFREIELWKLIGYLAKAIAEWMTVYPQEKPGIICPSNIIMNPQGQVRLITKLSFFLQVFGSYNEYYSPPESRGASLIQYALNPHKDPVAIEASLVYSSGAVILEAATLTLADSESFSREQKQMTFRNLNYSPQLKDTVLGMVELSQIGRIKLRQVLDRCKNRRHKH